MSDLVTMLEKMIGCASIVGLFLMLILCFLEVPFREYKREITQKKSEDEIERLRAALKVATDELRLQNQKREAFE